MESVKDNNLFNLLKEHEDPKSSWDLEDKIMRKIELLERAKEIKDNSLKYAWLFFGIGLISGSLITSFWFSPKEIFFNIPVERLIFPTQIGMVFFLLLFFNELYKTSLKKNKV